MSDSEAERVWGQYWREYCGLAGQTHFLKEKTLLGNMRCIKDLDKIDQYGALSMFASYLDEAMQYAYELGRKEANP